jgi:hypothetical protein
VYHVICNNFAACANLTRDLSLRIDPQICFTIVSIGVLPYEFLMSANALELDEIVNHEDCVKGIQAKSEKPLKHA